MQRPFFRYDLHTETVEADGRLFVDVTDPQSGKSFRFYDVEYAVACGLDGSRDLDALAGWAEDELGLTASESELQAVIDKLSSLGYLSGTSVDGAATDAAARSERATAPAPVPSFAAPLPSAAAATKLEIELGASGKSTLRQRPPMPSEAAEIELGLAGTTAAPAGKGPAATEHSLEAAIELGHAGKSDISESEFTAAIEAKGSRGANDFGSELSTDLSQTFRIDRSDVKEAVRQSKVMSAVSIPDDLKAEMEAMEIEAEEPAKPVARPAVKSAAELVDEIVETTRTGQEPIVLPAKPAPVAAVEQPAAKTDPKAPSAAKPKKAAAKRSAAGLVLWLLLLVAVGGAGAYYYFEFVHEPEPGKVAAPAPRPKEARKPAPPPPPTAVLEVIEAPTAELVAPRAGVVAWVPAAGDEVKEGEPVLKLQGFERIERSIENIRQRQAFYESKLQAAEAEGDERRIAAAKAKVDQKIADIEKENARLAEYVLAAPLSGLVEPLIETGTRAKVGDPLAKITGEDGRRATFTLPVGKTAAVGDALQVVAADDAELHAKCEVTEAVGQSVTVKCPADSGLQAGKTIQLKL